MIFFFFFFNWLCLLVAIYPGCALLVTRWESKTVLPSPAGYNYYGTERMYSGVNGRELEADIFIGVVYYQRLRHMVSDKFQVGGRDRLARETSCRVRFPAESHELGRKVVKFNSGPLTTTTTFLPREMLSDESYSAGHELNTCSPVIPSSGSCI